VRILIAVPTFGHHDSRFSTLLFQLAKLRGTDISMVRRSMPDKARNALAQVAIENGHDFIFFLDDDMVITQMSPPKMLDLLIQEMEANPSIDIMGVRAYRRMPPFFPCAFAENSEGKYDPIDTVKQGKIDVDAIHCAATIVRTSLFTRMSKPWFEFLTVGGNEFGEDISFTRKVKQARYRVVCHTDYEAGHIGDPAIIDSSAYDEVKRGFEQIAGSKKIVQP
jgi:hypothetical protein